MNEQTQSTDGFELPAVEIPPPRKLPIRAYVFHEDRRYTPLNADDMVLMIQPITNDKSIWVRPETPMTQLLLHILKGPGFPIEKMGEKQWVARRAASIRIPDRLKPLILDWPTGHTQIVFVVDESRVPNIAELRPREAYRTPNSWRCGSLGLVYSHDWFQSDCPEQSSTRETVIKSYNYQPPSGNIPGPSANIWAMPVYQAPGDWPADASPFNLYGQGPSTPFSP